MNGRLTPGSQLPTEARLAERFAVNRHTVREWIQYLRPLDGLPFAAYSGWESIADYMALLDGRTAQNVATFVPYANVRTLAMGFGEQTPNDYQLLDVQRQVAQGILRVARSE